MTSERARPTGSRVCHPTLDDLCFEIDPCLRVTSIRLRASRRGPVEHCHGWRHCGLASDTRRALPVKIHVSSQDTAVSSYASFPLYFLCHQTHADKAASHAHADYAEYRTHARIQRTFDWGNASLRPSPAPPNLHPWLSAGYSSQEAPQHYRVGSPVSLSA